MCLTLPVRVLEVRDGVAVVDVGGQRRVASTAAVAVAPGDWAILTAGVLIEVLDPAAASQLADAFHLATSPEGRPGRPDAVSPSGGAP
jgi:hydrogenase assembly chaperone HypC/HupF